MWSTYGALYRKQKYSSSIEHEATTSKISENNFFIVSKERCNQEEAVGLIGKWIL
jgi:Fe-S cluster assembly scaffold protein SufB